MLTNALHLTASNIRWLDGRWGGLTVAMMLGIWKGVGWNLVVFLAALQSVPQELYESAGIDGCGAFQKFFYVTLPSIKPTIEVLQQIQSEHDLQRIGFVAALSFVIARLNHPC